MKLPEEPESTRVDVLVTEITWIFLALVEGYSAQGVGWGVMGQFWMKRSAAAQ